MCECTTGEIWVRLMDCINVNILRMISCHTYASCYHGEKLGEGYTRSPHIISYNCKWIYNYLKSKKKKSYRIIASILSKQNSSSFFIWALCCLWMYLLIKLLNAIEYYLKCVEICINQLVANYEIFIYTNTQWLYFSC